MTDTRKIAEEIVKKYSVGFRPNEELIDDIEKVLTDMRNKILRECIDLTESRASLIYHPTHMYMLANRFKEMLSEPEKGEK